MTVGGNIIRSHERAAAASKLDDGVVHTLARQLANDTGEQIEDLSELRANLEDCALGYHWIKLAGEGSLRPKQIKKLYGGLLASVAKTADDLRKTLDDPYNFRPLDFAIRHDASITPEGFAYAEYQVIGIVERLETLRGWLSAAVQIAEAEADARTGSASKATVLRTALGACILRLAEIYEKYTGRRPGVATTGPFQRFVKQVMQHVDPTAVTMRISFEKTVRDILAEHLKPRRKRRTQSQG